MSTNKISDWEAYLKISRAAKEISVAADTVKPLKISKGLRFLQVYDMRGRISDYPNMMIISTTEVGLRFAVSSNAPADSWPCIMVPNLLFTKLNNKILKNQTGIDHELAHIVYGHILGSSEYISKISKEYFNQDIEIDAFFQQALANMFFTTVKTKTELNLNGKLKNSNNNTRVPVSHFLMMDSDSFKKEVVEHMIPIFWNSLEGLSKAAILHRIENFRLEGRTAYNIPSPEDNVQESKSLGM